MPLKTRSSKTGYNSDVREEEWAFCAPCLALMKEDAAQREYSSRPVFNAVCYLVRTGCPWRDLPNDLPPWYVVHQQAQRWIKAGCFEALAHDLRKMLRLLSQKAMDPSAVIPDGRTLQSTPESGKRAGYDGYKRKKGSKVHIAVDTLGHLLALSVTPANEQERAQVADLIQDVQEITGEKVQVAFDDDQANPSLGGLVCGVIPGITLIGKGHLDLLVGRILDVFEQIGDLRALWLAGRGHFQS